MKPNFEDFDEDTGSYDRTEDDQIGGSGQLLRNAIDIIATVISIYFINCSIIW